MRSKSKPACDERQMSLFGWVDEGPRKATSEAVVEERKMPEIDGLEINLSGAGANTKIGYRYRDADNYKKYKKVILAGRLSQADLRRMLGALFDHTLFLASAVGLQDLQTLFDNGWELEADHPWHELVEIAHVNDAPTFDEYQDVMTIAQFVAKWPTTAKGWDNVGAEERLINTMGLSKGSQKLLEDD